MRTPEWSDNLQRVILATALKTSFLRRIPGAFDPDLFGAFSDARTIPPRVRLARLIAEYAAEYGVPDMAVMDVLVQRTGGTLTATERQILADEWALVRNEAPPVDARWIEQEMVRWVEWRRLTQALVRAADAASAGPETLDAAKQLIAQGLEGVLPGVQPVGWLATSEERVRQWFRGEDRSRRVPTGFERLDEAIGGGVARGEVFYIMAPPKGAKTSFLVNVSKFASLRRYGVFFASFEMMAPQMMQRHDRAFAFASRRELYDDPQRLQRSLRSARAVGAKEIYVWQAPTQVPNACELIAGHVERLRREGAQVDLVIADYINIMGASRQEREKRHELARIARDLSSLAKLLDTVVWSAALIKRDAAKRAIIRKEDIGESYEVIAVANGAIAICGDTEMINAGRRGLFLMALREEQDERMVGVYRIDMARLVFDPLDPAQRSGPPEGASDVLARIDGTPAVRDPVVLE